MFDILDNKKNITKIKPSFINGKKIYIETYGCQMNLADTEVIFGILGDYGFSESNSIDNADIILLNTCSVRENAEIKIFNRLKHLKYYKKKNPMVTIGVLGCMAERLKNKLLEDHKIVDLIVGPDEYKKLPELIDKHNESGEKGIAVKLSKIETYEDINPIRNGNITAWISIMRGCDKFCSFCVVPFTRGRERSRKIESIVKDSENLYRNGVKDITLLGQNVNSYLDGSFDFPDLLEQIAKAVPKMRIRFITSHPYDLSVKLLETIAKFDNICNYIHLPVQSGSDRILKLMNRLYSVKHYFSIINVAREIIPNVGLSTDIITGFPSETEDDHKMTLDLMEKIVYDSAYLFAYSPRENTKAFKMVDDVPSDIKSRRLDEIVSLQRKLSLKKNSELINKTKEILLESESKKSKEFLMGRTDCNKSVIIKKANYKIGEFVNVKIEKVNSATLFGKTV